MNWTPTYTTVLRIIAPIIGSLIVVWITQITANRNLKITVNQLKSNHENELAEDRMNQKRTAYAKLLSSIEEMTETYSRKNSDDKNRFYAASLNMNSALSELDVFAPIEIALKAETIEHYVYLPRGDADREKYLNELANMMRTDLDISGRFKITRKRGTRK